MRVCGIGSIVRVARDQRRAAAPKPGIVEEDRHDTVVRMGAQAFVFPWVVEVIPNGDICAERVSGERLSFRRNGRSIL
jgi:hypothetical protein